MLEALEREVLSRIKDVSGRPLLVALSGGADSCALLFALSQTKKLHCSPLYALHVNHLLRGEESERDELAAKNLCVSLSIPLISVKVDVAEYSKKNGVGLEVAGREVRYQKLIYTAAELGAVALTAHTASDNVETVLFHLMRGTGLDGLCGIPSAIQKDSVTFLRPLLSVSREEILSYCEKCSIPFVTDSSNLQDDYTRNRIRNHIVPALKEACGTSPEAAVSRMIGILNEDKAALDYIAAKELARVRLSSENGRFALDAAELSSLPRGISSRVVRLAAKTVAQVSLSKAQCDGVLAILRNPSAAASVPSPLTVYMENQTLIFLTSALQPAEEFNMPLRIGVNRLPHGGKITLTKQLQVNSLLTNGAVDCNKINGILSARSRQTGDSILLDAKDGRKTLKKLFIEKKIPLRSRACVPVIVDESGAVVAVCGLGVDIRYKPLESQKNVLIIEFEEQTI